MVWKVTGKVVDITYDDRGFPDKATIELPQNYVLRGNNKLRDEVQE